MRRKQLKRGGQVSLLLASLTVLLTGCSTASVEDKLRFGWPRGVTKQAREMRVLWTWTGVTALALGVVVWALIFWACIRYRKRKDTPADFIPRQTKYNFTVEMVCFAFPFVIIAGLFYRTVIVEDDVNRLSAHPDVAVQVNAFKWGWQFEYTGYRGVNAQLADPRQQDALTTYRSGNTATGTMLTDPDDAKLKTKRPYYLRTTGTALEIPVLVIPVNQTVQIDEHSEDVLHSFWVPEFLFKRDVVPYGTTGTTEDNKFEFTATQEGHYVGRCAELCGVLHSQMNFEVRVVSKQTFQNYLDQLQTLGPNAEDPQAQALRNTGQDAYATTTYPFITDRTARKASERNGR